MAQMLKLHGLSQHITSRNMNTPKNIPPSDIPDDEDYTDFLEWTAEEEEAFLKILDEQKDENGDS
jgi:hypothetical protein